MELTDVGILDLCSSHGKKGESNCAVASTSLRRIEIDSVLEEGPVADDQEHVQQFEAKSQQSFARRRTVAYVESLGTSHANMTATTEAVHLPNGHVCESVEGRQANGKETTEDAFVSPTTSFNHTENKV